MAAPLTGSVPPRPIAGVTGRAVAVRGRDIDTDRIIPARFLRAITFDGLGEHAFADDRRAARALGDLHPFDRPAHAGASILLVNAHFGCGSSREHAPQALARRGIRAIAGESFAEIFFGNALAIGLPCLRVNADALGRFMAIADARPAAPFTIDVARGVISAGGVRAAAELPGPARDALLSGDWDVTARLREAADAVARTSARLPYLTGFPRPS